MTYCSSRWNQILMDWLPQTAEKHIAAVTVTVPGVKLPTRFNVTAAAASAAFGIALFVSASPKVDVAAARHNPGTMMTFSCSCEI